MTDLNVFLNWFLQIEMKKYCRPGNTLSFTIEFLESVRLNWAYFENVLNRL